MSPPLETHAAAGLGRHGYNDPVMPGISVGSAGRLNRGTIAAIVREMGEADLCILSCNHVISALAGHEGDAVCQPGRADEDRPGKNRLGAFVRGTSTPAVDAAIARIEHRHVVREIYGLGVPVDAVATPSQDDLVVLSGVGSGDTQSHVYGRVVLPADAAPDDADAPTTDIFSIRLKLPGSTRPGDSGAAWMLCDEQGEPTATMVGLHIGVGTATGMARACFAEKVFAALAIVPALDSEVEAHNLSGAKALSMTEAAASPQSPTMRYSISARNGLYLRSIAQRGDDAADRLVPFGTIVRILSRVRMPDGEWSQVDLEGDGKADGFMYSAYLVPAD